MTAPTLDSLSREQRDLVLAMWRQREAWLTHSCALCGPAPTQPLDLDPYERARRGDAMRKRHMARMTLESVRKRSA